MLFHVGREAGRRHGLGTGGSLLNGLDAVDLHNETFVSSSGLFYLTFKGSCNFLKSPGMGIRDFEKDEDQEDNEEASEDNKNVGS